METNVKFKRTLYSLKFIKSKANENPSMSLEEFVKYLEDIEEKKILEEKQKIEEKIRKIHLLNGRCYKIMDFDKNRNLYFKIDSEKAIKDEDVMIYSLNLKKSSTFRHAGNVPCLDILIDNIDNKFMFPVSCYSECYAIQISEKEFDNIIKIDKSFVNRLNKENNGRI